jgi:alkanesulfonate monooxygenase SsuD/methylene tetrahydromethanopterin reductase-like flavin-dependent oxidoreductase (luciferase family)
MYLALALSDAGWHPAAWREPAARPRELFTAAYWVDQVREAQSGRLDFVTIEDSFRLQSARADGPDGRTDQVRGRLNAVLIAARVAPVTQHIGIVPAATTTLTEPFALSTEIATLDYVSRGRAGWHAQISTDRSDGGYVGPRTIPPPQAIFDEAADHVEVVRRLWDSWEDGAEIRDATTGRFLDRDRLHYIDFEGPYFEVKGPSITPRPPQGQPIVTTLASTPAADRFAARSADIVFVTPRDEVELAQRTGEIDDALADAGRDPTLSRVFADVVVFLDDDADAADARRARLDALDGAVYTPDTLVFTGTPARLSEQLIAWTELGCRGFRLRPGAVPHDLHAITRSLVAELRDRGAFRREYESSTLRGALGLDRPANRYATA